MLLLEIRGKSIAFSAAVRKKERERENEIVKEIDILEKKEDIDLEKITELKRTLQNIREKKLKGMLIRSRAKWVEQGEKASKYFCNLENRNYVSKRMTSLFNENNEELTNPYLIRKEVFNFYNSLYSS